jgi:wyosine [tRNA(Phe)-imidazoG37] synthetase (radical SAM superfamily)
MERWIFGPVPSRRLGMSLGVNNIPYKVCSYSCGYCQIGKAVKLEHKRKPYYEANEIVKDAKTLLCNIIDHSQYPDYITIVPDGDPTLDIHLGELVTKLKSIGIPIAIITNASLINLPDVQQDLALADYVSIKIDTVNPNTFQSINNPTRGLVFEKIISGIRVFSDRYNGKLVTETMLIRDLNDSTKELLEAAEFIGSLDIDTAYLAAPTRPPANEKFLPSEEKKFNEAYHLFKSEISSVEFLNKYEGNAFASTGNLKEDILSITAVHPLREDAVQHLLQMNNKDINFIEKLIDAKLIKKIKYLNHNFYIRKFSI